MRKLRCLSCDHANRLLLLRSDQRPVYHDFAVYESDSGGLRYCGNCLIHAQIVLTSLLGYAMIYEAVKSDTDNRIKSFGTPMGRTGIIWRINADESIVGRANVK